MKLKSLFLALLVPIMGAFAKEPIVLLKDLEGGANPSYKGSGQAAVVDYLEVPLRLAGSQIAASVPESLRKYVLFEKNGEVYIRWFVNPNDVREYLYTRGVLADHGLSTELHKVPFPVYETGSRSFIVVDPETKQHFSFKVSTTNRKGPFSAGSAEVTGQPWNFIDPGNSAGATWSTESGEWVFALSEYVRQVETKAPFKSVVPFKEVMNFSLDGRALTIRDLSAVNGHHTYLPAFSLFDDDTARKIALLNGSTDPHEFWKIHYAEALARATTEFYLRTGIQLTSSHTQNFLIELDENLRPTGRIGFRDFGDSQINREYVKNIGQEAWIEKFSKFLGTGDAHMVAAFTHGNNSVPKWFPGTDDFSWEKDYPQMLRRELSAQAGATDAELAGVHTAVDPTGRFTGLEIPEPSSLGHRLLAQSKALQNNGVAAADPVPAPARDTDTPVARELKKIILAQVTEKTTTPVHVVDQIVNQHRTEIEASDTLLALSLEAGSLDARLVGKLVAKGQPRVTYYALLENLKTSKMTAPIAAEIIDAVYAKGASRLTDDDAKLFRMINESHVKIKSVESQRHLVSLLHESHPLAPTAAQILDNAGFLSREARRDLAERVRRSGMNTDAEHARQALEDSHPLRIILRACGRFLKSL